ncbi:phosphoribosylanthranilate isomerase [Thiovulum sp. ES]|nr:phosphoribosylanthranilate isomerase [Thiovulum sp. ES]
MKVKICGITNLDDAKMSIDSGADALGFVFYEKSPRYISYFDAEKIISQLPPFVEKVGLFVNERTDVINGTMRDTGLTLSQLHFEIEETELKKLEHPFIRVIRAKQPFDLNKFRDEYRIVDAFVEEYGGQGKRLNLDWFKNRDNSKIILAGGLNPQNVAETKDLGFYGVDVSSGVEERKGKKSQDLVREFIERSKY